MSEFQGIQTDRDLSGDLVLCDNPKLTPGNVHFLNENGLQANQGLRCVVQREGQVTPVIFTTQELALARVSPPTDFKDDGQRWSLVWPETEDDMATLAPERRDPCRLALATLQNVDPEGKYYDKKAAAQMLSAQQEGAEARFQEFLQRQERRFQDYYRTNIEHRVSRDQWKIQAGVDGLRAIVANLDSLSSALPQNMAQEIMEALQSALRKQLEADPEDQAKLSYYSKSNVPSEQFRTDLDHGPFIEQLEGYHFVLPNGVGVKGTMSERTSYPADSFHADWVFQNSAAVEEIIERMRRTSAEYNRRNHG